MNKTYLATMVGAAFLACLMLSQSVIARPANIDDAILNEPDQETQNISTAALRKILADQSAIVIDSRTRAEFVAGQIPGARALDVPAKERVSAIERIVEGDKGKALALYCNGPYCGASRTLADQLLHAGFTNVRRYQLGMPIWRALGGPTEIELEGIVRVFKADKTIVLLDARRADDFKKGTIAGASNIPPEKLGSGGPRGEPMPLDDFNRRVIIFGKDFAQARALADILSKRPWHNVMYYPGSYETLAAALSGQ
jgi:rhodanese-related sulfurtransferase